ncbi:hypothetical protein JB92DRAFT_3101623 [Gautieria morchelliformis]|nr:hypothetical protein JB92DRAFT_3101623 [Gautieria morchelliformis]
MTSNDEDSEGMGKGTSSSTASTPTCNPNTVYSRTQLASPRFRESTHPLQFTASPPMPRCSPPALLTAPTTLNCGHSVCSEHVTLPSSQPITRPSSPPFRPGPPILPACPLPTCIPVNSPATIPPTMPRESRVTYFPPAHHPQSTAVTPQAAVSRVQDVRLDVIICKIHALVHRAAQWQVRRDDHVPLPASSDGESEGENQEHIPRKTNRVSRSLTRLRHSSPPEHDRSPDSSSETPRPRQGRPSRRPVKRQRTGSQTAPPSLPSPLVSPASRFETELLTELTCEICFMLLYQPVTTPCQHTFCAKCLQRALDHSVQCPLCRTDLPGFSYFQEHPPNKVVLSIILKAFPDLYADRKATIQAEERDSRLDTPIFVCQLSFPGTPTILHFYEPRYRLMLRRCLETANPRFGMIMPPRIADGSTDFGTMLEIRTVQMFPDGRSMVETWGVQRFRVLERGTLDGYTVGRIELIDDFPLDVDDAIHAATASPGINEQGLPSSFRGGLNRGVPATNDDLMELCHEFLDKLRNGTAPWVVQRLNHTYGPEPVNDPSNFSFWMALVLPIDEHEKAKLLPIRSPRLRLRLVVHWIEQLNNTWCGYSHDFTCTCTQSEDTVEVKKPDFNPIQTPRFKSFTTADRRRSYPTLNRPFNYHDENMDLLLLALLLCLGVDTHAGGGHYTNFLHQYRSHWPPESKGPVNGSISGVLGSAASALSGREFLLMKNLVI